MKSIEEAAKSSYLIEKLDSGCNAGETFGKSMFKHGVEFAQRWIPVDEEMPTITGKIILLKIDNDDEQVSSGYYNKLGFIADYEFEDEFTVTHWRPIEYK